MAPNDRISKIQVKIERADEHIRNFQREFDAYLSRNPYRQIGDNEPETGDWVVKARISEALPLRFGAIIGDAVHNLRSSLDHLIAHLVEVNGGTVTNRTEFPFAGGSDEFENQRSKKSKGHRRGSYELAQGAETLQGRK